MAEESTPVLSPAEIIAEMNRNAGSEPAPVPKPVQRTQPAAPAPEPPPEPTPEPAPQPAAAPKPADSEPPKPPEKKQDYKVPDPVFVRKDQEPEPPAEGGPEGSAEPGDKGTSSPEPATPDADEVVFSRLSELTEGRLSSEEDFVGLINHYNELVEKAEKGFEPKFADERAKWAYQLLANNAGAEIETAQRTLHALSLKDVDKMDAKSALYNAYLMDPKNFDLTPAEAMEYFEAEYSEKYPDLENNPLLKRNHDVAAREARQQIMKIQSDFKATEAKPQQVSQDVIDNISNTVGNFGGVKIAFSDNPQESDYLTVPIDQKEVEQFQKDSLNPNEWLNNTVSQFALPDGRYDYEGYVREMYEMRNHRQIRQLAFEQGKKAGLLEKIRKDRNATTPQEIASVGSGGPAPVQQEGSFFDAWENAMSKR